MYEIREEMLLECVGLNLGIHMPQEKWGLIRTGKLTGWFLGDGENYLTLFYLQKSVGPQSSWIKCRNEGNVLGEFWNDFDIMQW